MAIGDPFGSLDSVPEEDWRYREAMEGLKNDPSQQPNSSWYDILNDIAHVPHRIIGGLGKMAATPAGDVAPAFGTLSPAEEADAPEAQPLLTNLGRAIGSVGANAVTAPRRVMTGELDPMGQEGTSAVIDMALLGGASLANTLERAAASPGTDLRVFGKRILSDSAPAAAPVAIAEHAQPFYSGLEHAVTSIPQNSMSGQQWLGTLANKAGVKLEELDWTGAKDMLMANADRPVTKAQLQDHLAANKVQLGEVTRTQMPANWKDLPSDLQYRVGDHYRDLHEEESHYLPDWYEEIASHSNAGKETVLDSIFNTPRYSNYSTPGGLNYREKLLTIRNGYMRQAQQDSAPFTGPHWYEKNVIGHLRMNDRNVRDAPVTTEQYQAKQDAEDALYEHQQKMQELPQQMHEANRGIRSDSNAARAPIIKQLAADVKSGKINMRQYNEAVENIPPVQSPHVERLQQLRAQHDELLRNTPPEPMNPELGGTPSLHVEEAQSDWHQLGRKFGYLGERDERIAALEKEESDLKNALQANVSEADDPRFARLHEIQRQLGPEKDDIGSIPHAPFKATPAWSNLLMKRALHEAAATGKTRISWSPGEFNSTNPKVLGAGSPAEQAKAEAGLKAFYDKMIVDQMNKIGKPHGASVERGYTEAGTTQGMSGTQALKLLGLPEDAWEGINAAGKREELFAKARAQGQPVYYMDIPESLRRQLLTRGMPLFEDSTSAAAPISVAGHISERAKLEKYLNDMQGGFSNLGVDPARDPVTGSYKGRVPNFKGRDDSGRFQKAVDPYRNLPDLNRETFGEPDMTKPKRLRVGGKFASTADYFRNRVPTEDELTRLQGNEFYTAANAPSMEAVSKIVDRMHVASGADPAAVAAWKSKLPTVFSDTSKPALLLDALGRSLGPNKEAAMKFVDDLSRALKQMYPTEEPTVEAWKTKLHTLFEDSSAAAPIAVSQHLGEGNVGRVVAADTHYAPQKVGLLPDWVMRDRPRPSELMPRDPNDLPALGAKYPQYAETYPRVGPPQLYDKATNKPIDAKGRDAQSLVDDGKAYWAKQNTPKATAFQKDRNVIQKDMEANGYDPFFPLEERSHVDPANYPTSLDMTSDALPAKKETIEKYRKMFNTPAARSRLQKAFEEGKKLGNAKDWYAMRQLEDQYIKHLGPEEGRRKFADEFAHTMAATTGGADPTSNLLLAHYEQWASRHGGIPEATHQLPFPIGGRYVANNIKQFKKMPESGGFTEANPKRHDFGYAFLGHANKATMDEQMSGALVPNMQMPPGDSYGIAAQIVHDLAKKNGVSPRDFQDVAWAGLKRMKVGDKFRYKGPMIQDVNDAIERTHRLTGMPRNEIVRRGVVKKEIPLYSNPAPLGALDVEQDRQR